MGGAIWNWSKNRWRSLRPSQALIDVIEVDDRKIRIKGSKDVLEQAVVASQNREAGCSQMSTTWRAGRDSNP